MRLSVMMSGPLVAATLTLLSPPDIAQASVAAAGRGHVPSAWEEAPAHRDVTSCSRRSVQGGAWWEP
jgi:hypothetical protein